MKDLSMNGKRNSLIKEQNISIMSKQNIALITGVTGQDGSYLAELLLEKDMMYTASFAVHP